MSIGGHAVRRSRLTRFDDRTGRLERAVDLVEDGQIKGLLTRRSERDLEHPQSRPIVIGPDRGARRQIRREVEKTHYTYLYGVGGFNISSNWERPQVPCLSYAASFGTFSLSSLEGYSHDGGYGVYGYGGFNTDDDTEGNW